MPDCDRKRQRAEIGPRLGGTEAELAYGLETDRSRIWAQDKLLHRIALRARGHVREVS
jgi:hypothetical protein